MIPAESRRSEFEATALPHLDDLFRTASAMVSNRTQAEDLVQETYLEAWKSFHRFQTGTNCRAWLFKILIHRVHHYRRKWYQVFSKTYGEELIVDNLRYEAPVSDSVTDQDILAALSRIPPMFREVILLADVQEFAYKEIAAMLDIPVGTVMSRLSRGRNHLRQHLLAASPSFRKDAPPTAEAKRV